MEVIKQYLEDTGKDYFSTDDLDTVINNYGRQNLVFEFEPRRSEVEEKKRFVMVEKNGMQKYSKNYKIYLLSLDLTTTEDFYVCDFVSLIRDGYIKIYYRFDLIH